MGIGAGAAAAVGAIASNAGAIGAGASLLGTAVSAVGSIQSAQSQSAAAKYSAAVATNNATTAAYNAQAAEDTQAAKTQSIMRSYDQRLGAQRAALGASGVNINSGSALDVQSATVQNQTIDANASNYQGEESAWGYRTQEQNFINQATLDSAQSSNASTAGIFSSAGTVLSGAGQVASRWYQFGSTSGAGTQVGNTFDGSGWQGQT